MRAAIFDLDGTLVDSTEDIVSCFAEALVADGRPAPGLEAVRPLVGRPLTEMFAAFAPPERVPGLVAAYRLAYWERCIDLTRPYPGAISLLDRLRDAGWALAVATNKRDDIARRVVAGLGLDQWITWVQGTEGIATKPAPDVVEEALARVGVPATSASWMVGDTVDDVMAGRSAGLSTAAVTTGSGSAEALAAAAPDAMVADLADLAGALLRGEAPEQEG